MKKWQGELDTEVNGLFDKKQFLDKSYNDSVDFYCKQDDRNIKQTSALQYKLAQLKRFQLVKANK